MNVYNLGISGSVAMFIAISIVMFIITFFIYKKTVPTISRLKRMILISLRSLSFALILFFLFEPVLTRLSYDEKPAIVKFFFDNSQSMAIKDAGGDRTDTYKKIMNNINFEQFKENSEYNLFGSTVFQLENITYDSLSFDETITDISQAITSAGYDAYENNTQAMVLITDGNFNHGINPIYSLEKFGKPIYVIAIGDSNHPKDAEIKNMLSNEIGYINSSVPVNVNVEISGIKKDSIPVKLYENKKLLATQYINANNDNTSFSLIFDYKPEKAGNYKLIAKIDSLRGEINIKNNRTTSFIRILENKRKIAIIGGAPNSDISFIKKYLTEDKDIEVKEYIQKKGGAYYNKFTPSILQKTELLILVDYPNKFTNQADLDLIAKSLEKGKPILFIAGVNTDYRKLRTLEEFLPFNTLKYTKRQLLAQVSIDAFALNSPLLRITNTDEDIDIWNSLPPLFRNDMYVKIKPESRLIALMKVNNVKIQEPTILSRNFGGQKSISILGYGLYRWKLMKTAADRASGNYDSYDVYSLFMNNCLKWLSVKDRNKKFIVKTSKMQYTADEEILFSAELYDASYTPIENAEIKIGVYNNNEPNKSIRDIVLIDLGNGRYKSELTGLSKGDFVFKAKAILNNRNYGSEKGRFSVGDISPEYLDIAMKPDILREIAERSGGKLFFADNVNELYNVISKHPKFVNQTTSKRLETILWDRWELLALVILLFATEWFLRKRNGLL